MKPYVKDVVTIALKDVEQHESLRVCVNGENDISFTDPEEATDFLRIFFGFDDAAIKTYWGVE